MGSIWALSSLKRALDRFAWITRDRPRFELPLIKRLDYVFHGRSLKIRDESIPSLRMEFFISVISPISRLDKLSLKKKKKIMFYYEIYYTRKDKVIFTKH